MESWTMFVMSIYTYGKMTELLFPVQASLRPNLVTGGTGHGQGHSPSDGHHHATRRSSQTAFIADSNCICSVLATPQVH